MDSITKAIVMALANLSNDAIKDGYIALKDALKKKFGERSDLVDAVDKLEKKSDSEARKATVKEEVETAKVNDDSEILRLAQDLQNLLDKLKEQSGGQQIIIQKLNNVGVAATSGTGKATNNITEHQASKNN